MQLLYVCNIHTHKTLIYKQYFFENRLTFDKIIDNIIVVSIILCT